MRFANGGSLNKLCGVISVFKGESYLQYMWLFMSNAYFIA